MPSDYRYDPFSDTSTAVSITNELHVIPTASPFTIRLAEVPDKTSALTMRARDSLATAITAANATSITVANGAWFASGKVITVDSEQMLVNSVASNTLTVTRGYNSTVATTHTIGTEIFIEESMTKVSSSPSNGQFWPDYSTGADQDDNWNTGLIQFNSGDAGKMVSVSYKGMGTLASIDFHGFKMFDVVGTHNFTVPKGINKVYVTGCGGGGAGASGSAYSLGDDTWYFARGGGAGAKCAVKTPLTVIPGQSYTITVGNGGAANQGAGGASSFGALLTLNGGGGANGVNGGVSGGFGGQNGGSGGAKDCGSRQGKGGSSIFGVGGVLSAETLGVNGSGYGAGGSSGGNNSFNGGAGSQGFILVEW